MYSKELGNFTACKSIHVKNTWTDPSKLSIYPAIPTAKPPVDDIVQWYNTQQVTSAKNVSLPLICGWSLILGAGLRRPSRLPILPRDESWADSL
jgi:hypothetical protein